ncbi:hypothetical protein HYV86_01710 [Candidatus Woesearchaeota archaeon]|nr:hypothetical protein [Candidatus Woesearchaeota archaeon]
MPKLYERKWWQKLFKKPEFQTKVDVLNDIDAIRDYLDELKSDAKAITLKLNSLEELEKERQVAKSGIEVINLQAQGKILDELLDLYETFQNDADINGLRLKMICKEYLKNAQKAGMTHLVEEKKNSARWKMQW